MSSPLFARPGRELVLPCVHLGGLGLFAYWLGLLLNPARPDSISSLSLRFQCEQNDSGRVEVHSFIDVPKVGLQAVDVLQWGEFASCLWVRVRSFASKCSFLIVLRRLSRSAHSCFVTWVESLRLSRPANPLFVEAIRASWGQR